MLEVEQLARVLGAVAEPRAADDAGGKWARTARATPLNELYLGANALGDAGGCALVGAASTVHGLTWLSLVRNPRMGDATLLELARLLADKGRFRRLKEIRAFGSGASRAARAAVEKACKERGVGCKTEAEAEQRDAPRGGMARAAE